MIRQLSWPIEVLLWHLPGGTAETTGHLRHDSKCPKRDSITEFPEYKSNVLPTHQSVLYSIASWKSKVHSHFNKILPLKHATTEKRIHFIYLQC